MAKHKLTKVLLEAAKAEKTAYEIRDTVVPGFLVKVTPMGRKIFMIAYISENGRRRKPAIGRFGELTVEQARDLARDWLAEVRRGKDPSVTRLVARQSPTLREFFERYITEYSVPQNKPSTVKNNRCLARTHILPALGDMKVVDVTRPDIAALMREAGAGIDPPTRPARSQSPLHRPWLPTGFRCRRPATHGHGCAQQLLGAAGGGTADRFRADPEIRL
jgi:hypothetical protein